MGRGARARGARLRRRDTQPSSEAATSWAATGRAATGWLGQHWPGSLDTTARRALEASLLRGGYGRAATCVAVAVVANHIRRLLVPWLGQFAWRHAVADMKLARSAPYALLEASLLDFDWADVARWAGQRIVVGAARAVVTRRRAHGQQPPPPPRSRDRQPPDVASDAGCVLLLFGGLARLEHLHVESCWAAAHLYATARLLLSPRAGDRAFVRRLVLEVTPRARLALQAGLVLCWLRRCLSWPRRGVLLAGACAVATMHVLRYSGRYFMLLEMSDMLVTFAWMLLGLLVLTAWAVCDWALPRLCADFDGGV